MTKQNEPVPAGTIILSEYLSDYIPADETAKGVVVMTTDDIISALGTMVELTQGEVVTYMIALGYTAGRNSSGSFGWLLQKAE